MTLIRRVQSIVIGCKILLNISNHCNFAEIFNRATDLLYRIGTSCSEADDDRRMYTKGRTRLALRVSRLRNFDPSICRSVNNLFLRVEKQNF